MTWDNLDLIVTQELDGDTDQPAKARPVLRQMARNVSTIRQARDGAMGIAGLDADGRLDPDSVISHAWGFLWTHRAETKWNAPNGLGAFMEFERDSNYLTSNDVATFPTRLTVPTLTPSVSLARVYFNLQFFGISLSAYYYRAELWKNGAILTPEVIGYIHSQNETSNRGVFAKSSPLAVVAGDYFELKVIHGYTSPVPTVGYFAMDILE
jgi:hypothetical protein